MNILVFKAIKPPIIGVLVRWNTERNNGERSAELRRTVCTGLNNYYLPYGVPGPNSLPASIIVWPKYSVFVCRSLFFLSNVSTTISSNLTAEMNTIQ